jgi:hypothetical protein
MKAAMVDSTTKVLLTSRITELQLKLPIPTLPKLKLAKSKEDLSRYQESKLPKDALMFKTLSKPDRLVSQLMLLTGADMPQESSITVEEILTMTSNSSVLPQVTTKSRTLGELHGESKASFVWLSETPAVSVMIFHLGSNDHSVKIILEYIYTF